MVYITINVISDISSCLERPQRPLIVPIHRCHGPFQGELQDGGFANSTGAHQTKDLAPADLQLDLAPGESCFDKKGRAAAFLWSCTGCSSFILVDYC